MNYDKTIEIVHRDMENSMLPGLIEFVKIPNLSPEFDPEYFKNGLAQKAGNHLINWAKSQGVKGLSARLLDEPNRTPMVVITVEPSSPEIKKTILLYGHFDKQPHMNEGWNEGTGPITPVVKNGFLYGRGASDDGYATFTCVEAIKAIQENGGKHGKIFITVEAGEESGSPDLMYHLKNLAKEIGNLDLMICMDSGCADYNTLWITNSLRGMCAGEVEVQCLKENVHSGSGSGIAPDSFTVLRQLLDRIEDSKTAQVIKDFHVEIPDYIVKEAKKLAEYQKEKVVTDKVKLLDQVKPVNEDYVELLLNNTWRPTMVITGMSGFPKAEGAGNVLRDKTKCKISLRFPPTYKSSEGIKLLEEIVTKNPPYNSKITFTPCGNGNGFAAKDFDPKIKASFANSAKKLFNMDYYCYGEGGSIPFISELGEEYPDCSILVTGVLGPLSNAHCPNESLNIKYTELMTVAIAHVINDYCS